MRRLTAIAVGTVIAAAACGSDGAHVVADRGAPYPPLFSSPPTQNVSVDVPVGDLVVRVEVDLPKLCVSTLDPAVTHFRTGTCALVADAGPLYYAVGAGQNIATGEERDYIVGVTRTDAATVELDSGEGVMTQTAVAVPGVDVRVFAARLTAGAWVTAVTARAADGSTIARQMAPVCADPTNVGPAPPSDGGAAETTPAVPQAIAPGSSCSSPPWPAPITYSAAP